MIKYQLVNTLGRGITVYKGERGFMFVHTIKETQGGVLKRRPSH
jgi:hypothetical protein